MITIRRCGCVSNVNVYQHVFKRCISFQDLDINIRLTRMLRSRGITEPSDIQVKAIQFLLNRNNAVINSETGSGKTLAYALPIVNAVHEIKKNGSSLPFPYSLVVVPNKELQYQVGNVFRRLLGAKVSIANEDSPLRSLNTEVVVSIPTHLITYPLDVFKQIRTVVFDEADLMIAKKVGKHGNKDPLFNLIKYLIEPSNFQSAHEGDKRQFIFAGATMPDNLSRKSKFALPYIRSWVPDITVIRSENVHKMISNVQVVYDNVLQGNKLKRLVNIVNDSSSASKLHVLVFVNTLEAGTLLYKSLNNFDYTSDYSVGNPNILNNIQKFRLDWDGNIHLLHKNVGVNERFDIFDRFSTSSRCLVITTDIASRGIDFPHIDLVIQYDFAKNVIDVLHRVGRTGRMGKEGKVVNFITEADESLSNALQETTKDGNSFDNLFSRHRSLRRKIKRSEKALQRTEDDDIYFDDNHILHKEKIE